jgi:hypothetical protein
VVFDQQSGEKSCSIAGGAGTFGPITDLTDAAGTGERGLRQGHRLRGRVSARVASAVGQRFKICYELSTRMAPYAERLIGPVRDELLS